MASRSLWCWVVVCAWGCGQPDRPPYIDDKPIARGGNGGGGSSEPTAGATGEAGADPGLGPATRPMTKLVDNGPWDLYQETSGIAADGGGRVFINDENAVYVVEDGQVELFLTTEDGVAAVGEPTNAQFRDLDIDADGSLYVSFGVWILRTDTAHEAEVWRKLDTEVHGSFIRHLGVVSNRRVVLVGNNGLALIGNDNEAVYSKDEFDFDTDCACEDMAVARSGVFLYQPGCNGSPLGRGNADGSGVDVVYDDTLGLIEGARYPIGNFLCSARSERGGFYTILEGGPAARESAGIHLFHFTEDSTQDEGYSEVVTSPWVPNVAYEEAQNGVTLAFRYCSIATAPDDTIYVQTMGQLWRIDP